MAHRSVFSVDTLVMKVEYPEEVKRKGERGVLVEYFSPRYFSADVRDQFSRDMMMARDVFMILSDSIVNTVGSFPEKEENVLTSVGLEYFRLEWVGAKSEMDADRIIPVRPRLVIKLTMASPVKPRKKPITVNLLVTPQEQLDTNFNKQSYGDVTILMLKRLKQVLAEKTKEVFGEIADNAQLQQEKWQKLFTALPG